jgi:hypothetical protein
MVDLGETTPGHFLFYAGFQASPKKAWTEISRPVLGSIQPYKPGSARQAWPELSQHHVFCKPERGPTFGHQYQAQIWPNMQARHGLTRDFRAGPGRAAHTQM